MWLGYDHFTMCHSVIPYRYVDSSYRSLIVCLLHLCYEDRSPLGMGAWGLVGGRSLVYYSWCRGVLLPCVQDSVSSSVWKIHLCHDLLSVTVIDCVSLWFGYTIIFLCAKV